MFLAFITLISIQSIVLINAESFLDLPPEIPKGDIAIHATLTDISSGETYFLQEFISSNYDVQGKIEIDSKADSSEVHYSTGKDNQRLVLQGNRCDLFSYKSGWDKKLPGINKPLLNLLLLLGPSVLYRINRVKAVWNNASDCDVRGTLMHGATITMNSRLKITNYYKTKFDRDEGLTKPTRIMFEGNDPGAPISQAKETLIMDIYLHEQVDYELSDFIQIPPGVGCPFYLAEGTPFPQLNLQTIQMIVLENVYGPSPSSTKSEIYIDDEQEIMRLISTSLGVKTDAIYDYNLGLIYVKEEQNCLVSPLTLSSPGVNEAGSFSLSNWLWFSKSYLYLGQLDFERRPGFQVRAWEATEYDMTIGSIKYDKIVTTAYFSDSKEASMALVIVGATRNAYKKGSAGDYILIETTTRDFYDLIRVTSDAEFTPTFQLDDCFQNSENRIELNFRLSCSSSDCYSLAQSSPETFKNRFKTMILNDRKISPLRITTTDLKFGLNRIDIFMTILEGPTIDEPFRQRSLTIDQEFLRKLGPLTTNSAKACLTLQSSIVAPIKTVIYCGKVTSGNCYHLETSLTITTDPKGSLCSVWDFPLNNLYRVGHELTLEEIHENLLDKTKYNLLTFQMNGNRYRIDDVVDVTRTTEETQFPYAVSRHSSKLKSGSDSVISVPDATNFGSCYRACVHSDEDLCESFSYCEYAGKVECLVTSTMYDKIDDATVDEMCNIYSKNHLSDYQTIKRRRFISPTSIATDLPLYDCATFCYASEDCYSFQYCNGYCTFAGFYTDSATEYREDCDIYSPKASHKYQITGDKTVDETFHTELNLNLEQCAALCNDWKTDNEACKSFNFCPKGRTPSSCYLSKYTVKDGSTIQKESGACLNYEQIVNNQDNGKARNSESIRSASSGSAFGIIMLFLVGGLIVGFAVPIGYRRITTLPSLTSMISFGRTTVTTPSDPQFGWSKQVNDDEDQSRV